LPFAARVVGKLIDAGEQTRLDLLDVAELGARNMHVHVGILSLWISGRESCGPAVDKS
jgi:hypothetical protein